MSEEIPIELYRTTNNEFVKFVRYEEIEKLNNIINELEKWLYDRSELTNFGVVLDKIKELKGSDEE